MNLMISLITRKSLICNRVNLLRYYQHCLKRNGDFLNRHFFLNQPVMPDKASFLQVNYL